MTRANKNTWSISSFFGTLPNSLCKATAIFALRSFFFCSGVTIRHLYQNPYHLSRYETMIVRCNCETHASSQHPFCEPTNRRVSKRKQPVEKAPAELYRKR